MQKWEYLYIVADEFHVFRVNMEVLYKTEPSGLFSSGERYGIPEYLSSIGKEGWEVISVSSASASPHVSNFLIAKRPLVE